MSLTHLAPLSILSTKLQSTHAKHCWTSLAYLDSIFETDVASCDETESDSLRPRSASGFDLELSHAPRISPSPAYMNSETPYTTVESLNVLMVLTPPQVTHVDGELLWASAALPFRPRVPRRSGQHLTVETELRCHPRPNRGLTFIRR